MVSYCCVKGCSNNSTNKKKNPSSLISFHAFPSNQELKSKWLRAIGRPNWIPPYHSRICSSHFNYDQINYDGCRVRIKEDAVPVNSLPLNSNFEASEVEACRICLATDVKMYSLRGTDLGQCINSIAGFNKNFNIDGLPQYICYQCAPQLIKCNKLLEKSWIAQATLLDIFVKNGQITKTLIKEQDRHQLNLLSALDIHLTKNYCYIIYEGSNNFAQSKSYENFNCFKNETMKGETKSNVLKIAPGIITKINDIQGIESNEVVDEDDVNNSEYDPEEVKLKESQINYPGEILKRDTSPNEAKGKMHRLKEVMLRKKLAKKASGLTPDETTMLKYFDIINLSFNEQVQEWVKSTACPIPSRTVYKCDVCCKRFSNANTYQNHITTHDPSQGRAECPVCKLRFKTATLATSHAKRAHSKKFLCKSCPKTFNNVGVAKKHQLWHAGHVYSCSHCSFRSAHASSLGAHRRRAHGTRPCALCGAACVSSQGLYLHTHAKHRSAQDSNSTNIYRCVECKIDFVSEGARRVHLLTSNQHKTKTNLCEPVSGDPSLRNTCTKCGTICSSRSELVAHSRAEHPRAKQRWRGDSYPSTCELCGETISSRKKHWLHVLRQHPKHIDTYRPVITAVCDICGKGFQNSTKLRLHQLRHGSPSERCSRCARAFYDKYALARHARTHDPAAPHQCRTCGRAFKLRTNLHRHHRVHTDITPYECTMCGKKFKYSSGVNLHVRTVHYKLPHPPRKKKKCTKETSDL